MKWCNARSEREGRTPAYYSSAAQTTVYRTGQIDVNSAWVKWTTGYRLPTEAEWEKAARGGAAGHRFPCSDADTIDWSRANYVASPGSPSYDVNLTSGSNPAFTSGGEPYTSPVGLFAPNGYGLYDMAGNVWQWCWDWSGAYSGSPQTDPRGPASGGYRVPRGCGWSRSAYGCRTACRDVVQHWAFGSDGFGFRCVLPPGQ